MTTEKQRNNDEIKQDGAESPRSSLFDKMMSAATNNRMVCVLALAAITSFGLPACGGLS